MARYAECVIAGEIGREGPICMLDRILWLAAAPVLLYGAVAFSNDIDDARKHLASLPLDERRYQFYLSFQMIEPAWREPVATSLMFALASTSKQPNCEIAKIHVVTPTLARIDVRDYRWIDDFTLTSKAGKKNKSWDELQLAKHFFDGPYNHNRGKNKASIVYHPGHFLMELIDAKASSLHNQLLYGQEELTRDDFFKFWGVDKRDIIGAVEGSSGVSRSELRWILNVASGRSSTYGTLDWKTHDRDTDPINNLDYFLKRWQVDHSHDGEEWIVLHGKFRRNRRGSINYYHLFNGKGIGQTFAPADLVVDTSFFRRSGEIVNFGGCINCHSKGFNLISRDEVQEFHGTGSKFQFADRQKEAQVMGKLQPMQDLLKGDQETYAAGVEIVTKKKVEEFAKDWQKAVGTGKGTNAAYYDQDVSIERAATELMTNPESVKLAIAEVGRTRSVTPRLALLASGKSIKRELWEAEYLDAYNVMEEWRNEDK